MLLLQIHAVKPPDYNKCPSKNSSSLTLEKMNASELNVKSFLPCVQSLLNSLADSAWHCAFTITCRPLPDSGTHSHPDLLALLLTLDTLGQSQSPLHIPADGLEAVLELLITVVLLASTGVIAAVMLVATFGHGRDAYVKLEKIGFSHLYN